MPETRWDPFRDLIAIQDRMNRLFETALSGTDFGGEDSGIGTWSPVADLVSTPEQVVVTCELPGIERDAIEIKLADSELTVSGERKVSRESELDQYHRIERSYGPFKRTFTIPVGVDAERIAAQYQNGVLTVSMPRRPETLPRRITVRAS